MTEIIQDAVVTVLALGAVAALVRRLAGMVGPSEKGPGCSSCPSCPDARAGSDAVNLARPLPIVDRSPMRNRGATLVPDDGRRLSTGQDIDLAPPTLQRARASK
ncbi:MAG: hypothetical protein ACREUZ_20515 [Burkholderiales bacterium]